MKSRSSSETAIIFEVAQAPRIRSARVYAARFAPEISGEDMIKLCGVYTVGIPDQRPARRAIAPPLELCPWMTSNGPLRLIKRRSWTRLARSDLGEISRPSLKVTKSI